MAYTYLTKAQFRAQLAARLHDSSMVTWVSAELDLYIAEALRTFSALSGFWREQASFSTAAGTLFYDLPTQFPTQLGYTVTNLDLFDQIAYHLLEPPALGWTGTEQFSTTEVLLALQRRRNQFLMETGVRVETSTQAVVAPAGGRVSLDDAIIDVRRVTAYTAPTYTHLWRADEWAATTYDQTWTTSSYPATYSVATPPPITLQLIPPLVGAATLNYVTVNSGADLNVLAAVAIGVPDDLTWVVKWGALADLLAKDGPARDPERAEMCEQRYQQGIEIAKLQARITAARIGTAPLTLGSLMELDAYYPDWENVIAATPTDLVTCGLNLVAAYPTPVGVTTITLDLIRNASVPAADGDNIQLGREQIEALLDYCEYLALFKHSGPEFAALNMCWENLLRVAARTSGRMSAAAQYLDAMTEQSKREERFRPRVQPEMKEAANG